MVIFPNFLMVGDWVSVTGWFFESEECGNAVVGKRKYTTRICRVTSVGQHIGVDALVEDYVVNFIELTDKILENNGWYRKPSYFVRYVHELADYRLVLTFNLGASTFEASVCYRKQEYVPFAEIHYVHELQHVLRVCGLRLLADKFDVKKL